MFRQLAGGWFLGTLLGLYLISPEPVYSETQKSGLYVGGLVGGTFRPDTRIISTGLGHETAEFKPGFTFGGMLGYDFGQGIRIEGEISYHENAIRTGGGKDPQAGTSTMMLNAFYDLYPFKDDFEIYFGAGFGVATAQLESFSLGRQLNESETIFAYQLEGGIGFNVTPLATFTLGYRYFDTDDPDFQLNDGNLVTMGWSNHEVILKMRYRFPL